MSTEEEQRALAHLMADVVDHQLTVLHEDGLYRHVRLAKPGTVLWRIDLVTWPGYLTICGDLETYTFRRLPDMFEFFRSKPGRINAYYWSEKLANGRTSVQVYSEEKFKAAVKRHVTEWSDDEQLTREILADVTLQWDSEVDTSYEHPAREWLDSYSFTAPDGSRFEFTDTWDWDLKDFDYHFLRACHAIVWAINQYDASKASTSELAAS